MKPTERATKYISHPIRIARARVHVSTLLSLRGPLERSQMTPRPSGARFLAREGESERTGRGEEKKGLTRVNREQDIPLARSFRKPTGPSVPTARDSFPPLRVEIVARLLVFLPRPPPLSLPLWGFCLPRSPGVSPGR